MQIGQLALPGVVPVRSEVFMSLATGLITALSRAAAMIVRPRTSEKTRAVLEEMAAAESSRETVPDSGTPRSGHGRNGAQAFAGAQQVTVAHAELSHGGAARNAEKETYTARRSRGCWSGLWDRLRWQPRFTRSSACAGAAGKCSLHRNRRVRKIR